MSKDLTSLLSETIYIPRSIREWTVADLEVSIRLWNVLESFGCRTLGDLQGKSYKEIYLAKNCGRKTILELKHLIDEFLSDEDLRELSALATARNAAETLYIPQEARGLPLAACPMPIRLFNVLRGLDFRLVGDLHGFSVKELKGIQNCGSQTVSDLELFVERIQQGEFETKLTAAPILFAPQDLNLTRFVEFIDEFLNEISPRDRDVLALRFGAAGDAPLTLEQVGEKYGVTRERIRQIESGSLKNLKARLGAAGERLSEQTNRDCLAALCPLTPQLLVYWTEKESSDFQHSPSFYIRLLKEFAPEIPVLPEGQTIQGPPRSEDFSRINQAINRRSLGNQN